MKRFSFVMAAILILTLCTMHSAPCAALSLTASWTAPTTNADGTALTDLASYNLYRTDGTRTKINTSPIAVPATSYSFSVTVSGSGTLTFVATAVDTSGNESADSNVASYVYTDTTIPSPPKSLLMQKGP